ncbi:heavy-metal-associated domain-containing protein [Croceicoccus sp. Ery15]|uniref:heavy-metal-associated domain-containing protein n=1 Tax=Croceicoccus sp. Ery15 TaxID=1703338 RepID=UPI001E38B484|nr:heavy-metal-associated domain-containing protein [Croceicoccus sp. Ery15]
MSISLSNPVRDTLPYRAIFVVFVLTALALAGWRVAAQVEGDRGIAPIASSGDFEVDGISVNATGKTAEEARTNGWLQAQRKAWDVLYARTHAGAKAPQVPDSRLAQMVSAVVVEREEIGPRRYVAKLGVIFDRARAGELFGQTDAMVRSAPMLVLPVTYSGGVAQLYEHRTPWQRAWAQFRTGSSPIDYVRPFGAGGESLLLTAGQASRRSRSWWRNILDEFGAADVLVPVARLERQWPGGPVVGTFTARHGPDNAYLGSFTMTAADDAELPAMLERAVERMDAVYARAMADGRLRVDNTLNVEEATIDPALIEALTREAAPAAPANAPQPGTAAPVPQPVTAQPAAPLSRFAVQVATPDPASLDAALTGINGTPGVANTTVGSLAIGGTSVLQVGYAGNLDGLAEALRARGWQVTQGADALRISR